MKLRLRGVFFSFILVFIACATLPIGSAQMEKKSFGVSGRIYVMGNEPFTRVAIQADDGRVFALSGKNAGELRALQGRRLSVEGALMEKNAAGVEEIEVVTYKIIE
jgi:hypothetical protein